MAHSNVVLSLVQRVELFLEQVARNHRPPQLLLNSRFAFPHEPLRASCVPKAVTAVVGRGLLW